MLAGGAAGSASGWASGHWGVVVELEDGAVAPDEDSRRPAMRSVLQWRQNPMTLDGSLGTTAICGKE
jgi:hypothetical protein